MLLIVEWYIYASFLHYSLLHTQAIWYSLLLLGYKPVQHVTALNQYHHHSISFTELGHLLTRSGLTYSEVSSKILSGFFPWHLPEVKISPEWITGPEQGKSSGRIATFSLWTGMFRDGISSIPGETVIPLWLGLISSFVRTGYTTRRWGWLLGRKGCRITDHYLLYATVQNTVGNCNTTVS